MKMSDAFPSNWLKASDLGGKTVKATINLIQMEEVGDGHKPVLYFVGKNKGLVLNKTNATMIAYVFGDDSDNWAGAEIELYPTMTSFQGKPVEAIRVNVRPPAAPAQQTAPAAAPRPANGQRFDERNPPPIGSQATAAMDDDIPF